MSGGYKRVKTTVTLLGMDMNIIFFFKVLFIYLLWGICVLLSLLLQDFVMSVLFEFGRKLYYVIDWAFLK